MHQRTRHVRTQELSSPSPCDRSAEREPSTVLAVFPLRKSNLNLGLVSVYAGSCTLCCVIM